MHKRFSTLTAIVVLVIGAALGVGTPASAQTAECSDGSVSNGAHFQGTCSHHGGVEVWLDEAMREQANEWCDDNPDLCDKSNSHWEGIEGHGNHPAEGDASLANTRAEAKIEANARKREAAGYDPDGIVLRGGSRR